MHGNRAKVALSDAAAMCCNGLFDRGERSYFPGFIIRVCIPGKLQVGDLVQFGCREERRTGGYG